MNEELAMRKTAYGKSLTLIPHFSLLFPGQRTGGGCLLGD
jgi:hypothetical protein